ncbi:uncharacterized protein LOC134217232 [Armigeres subalbatus]|uniref:uncharacterized protein LOC134217232 n=1 Tax=Armigeres subalbatus TaxID=124917 RepID=UPI002ED2AA24
MVTERFCFAGLLLVGSILVISACNGGYELIVHKIENCQGSVITIDPDSVVTLTEDCKVQSKSTVSTTGFKDAEMTVTLSKNGIPVMQENMDLCSLMDDSKSNSEAAEIMTMFGVPDECPVTAQEIKTDESQQYSLEKYKQHLMMAEGKILVDCHIKHDSGESCIKVHMEVKKPGRMIG